MSADPPTPDSKLPTIALIGPMGAGKTEVGRRLAKRLGRPLVDTDELIVERDGRSVSEIFSEESEAGFRAKELEAVADAAAVPGAVIATGGGVVLDPRNVEALQSSGEVIYLRASAAVAAARLGTGEGRPLLEGTPLGDRIARLIEDREDLYRQAAGHEVDADADPDDVVDALVEIWEAVCGPRFGFSIRGDGKP
ncbi:MAG TPA: shikimate kinase [Actinomycetota bacterium]|nr:shikimate kinase [Actinomycetota bacterium]